MGPARQGKSRFLQSVSGLDSRVIPAFEGDHCTGATSIIRNENIEGVKALIGFKTKKEVIQEVQDYLDIILGRNEYFISYFSDIAKINLGEIDRRIGLKSATEQIISISKRTA